MFSIMAVANSECRIACIYEGYGGGFYHKGKCACVDLIDMDLIEARKVPSINKKYFPPNFQEDDRPRIKYDSD